MSEHDPLCPCAKWRADLALCACRTIRTIRADERAKAVTHGTGTDTGGPCCECCYASADARIARNGGSDDDA